MEVKEKSTWRAFLLTSFHGVAGMVIHGPVTPLLKGQEQRNVN